MSDIPKTVRPDVVPASVQHLDGLLGPLAAYVDALEARICALERRSSTVPLMTATDAATYARVTVETSLSARSGPASCRWPAMSAAPPDLSRCPGRLARYQIVLSAAGCFAAPRASRAKGSEAVEAAWRVILTGYDQPGWTKGAGCDPEGDPRSSPASPR